MRGRVVALYAMGFMGMMPWGSLVLGLIAEKLGIGVAIATGGTICILGGLLAWADRRGASWKIKVA
jgi:fucose permease